MAFTGCDVVVSRVGNASENQLRSLVSIFNGLIWSENLASDGRTTKVAPDPSDNGSPVFHIVASANGYVAIGPGSPNANSNPRIRVYADVALDIFAKPGDKVHYVAV